MCGLDFKPYIVTCLLWFGGLETATTPFFSAKWFGGLETATTPVFYKAGWRFGNRHYIIFMRPPGICMGVAWASHGDLLGMPAVETAGDGG